MSMPILIYLIQRDKLNYLDRCINIKKKYKLKLNLEISLKNCAK